MKSAKYAAALLCAAGTVSLAAEVLATTQLAVTDAVESSARSSVALQIADDSRANALIERARAAMAAQDYSQAIRVLTSILEVEQSPNREQAQEMIGVARERNGQLAHAKAEYEAYLAAYPDGAATTRVRARLKALVGLDRLRPATAAVSINRDEDEDNRWEFHGGWSQIYRRDAFAYVDEFVNIDSIGQSALISDLDLSARRQGERTQFEARVAGGYINDFMSDGPGNRGRIYRAYLDFADEPTGLGLRVGRQRQHSGGLLGRFDGAVLSYQPWQAVRLRVSRGTPVSYAERAPDLDRQFTGVSVDWLNAFMNTDVSVYGVTQQLNGESDRKAVGVELRHLSPGVSVLALLDYDLYFGALNSVLLTSNVDIGVSSALHINLDRRKGPILSTYNALIGQYGRSLDDLMDEYGAQGVRDIALDRTADATSIIVGGTHRFGEHFRLNADVIAQQYGDLPASAGVPALVGTGWDVGLSTSLVADRVFGERDLNTVSVRMQNNDRISSVITQFNSRWRVADEWRIGPRLRFDRRQFARDDSVQWLIAPALRFDYSRHFSQFELESGYEWSTRDVPDNPIDQTQWFISAGYRLFF